MIQKLTAASGVCPGHVRVAAKLLITDHEALIEDLGERIQVQAFYVVFCRPVPVSRLFIMPAVRYHQMEQTAFQRFAAVDGPRQCSVRREEGAFIEPNGFLAELESLILRQFPDLFDKMHEQKAVHPAALQIKTHLTCAVAHKGVRAQQPSEAAQGCLEG